MGKRITLEAHLEPEELHRCYRTCRETVERSRWQMIWLLAEGWKVKDIAAATGFSAEWVCDIVNRYNRDGPDALIDGRKLHSPGQKPLLNDEDLAELAAALEQPLPDGGFWNSVRVAAWMSERTGRQIDYRRGWEYLNKLGYRPQVPRPHHAKRDEEAEEAFKKGAPPNP